MNKEKLLNILTLLRDKNLSIDEAFKQLKNLSFENLGYAHVDHNRSLRKGVAEVVFGEGKKTEYIIGIIKAILEKKENIIVTRLSKVKAKKISKVFKEAFYDETARILTIEKKKRKKIKGKKLLIISAGTSDIPVAKESEVTAKFLGCEVETIFDVGIAGIHRLFFYKDKIDEADVIIVVAGMEGALPGIVAGITSAPVIGVPTSVGYGTGLNGITPLFTMLNSCSSNVSVVNIDNGFGAAYFAYSIFSKN